MSRQTYYYSARLENMQLQSSSYVCWEWNRGLAWNAAVCDFGYVYRARQMTGLPSWLLFWCQFQTGNRVWKILRGQFIAQMRSKYIYSLITPSVTHPNASSLNHGHPHIHTLIALFYPNGDGDSLSTELLTQFNSLHNLPTENMPQFWTDLLLHCLYVTMIKKKIKPEANNTHTRTHIYMCVNCPASLCSCA